MKSPKHILKALTGGMLSTALLLSPANGFGTIRVAAVENYDYCEALAASLYFFDENACGSDVDTLGIQWRGDCHTYDAQALISQADGFPSAYTSLIDPDGDGRVDVSGGYHDAGDHVKFNVTMGFAGSSLAMAEYLFPGAYEKAGCRDHMEKIVKRNAEYLMKTTWLDENGEVVAVCHVVADGNADHSHWESPEKQTYERKTYWLNKESNNSVVCCEMVAALAGCAYVVKDTDASYAAKCVKYAKALVDFATAHPGNEGRGNGSFYGTDAQYEDELALAQCWLWILGEGDRPSFRPTGGGGYNDQYYDCYLYCWDKVWQGYSAMMYKKTGEKAFADELRFELQNKGGLSESSYNTLGVTWGVSRANCAFQMDALTLAAGNADSSDAKAAKYQMDYLLGNNDYGYSFLIGYGAKYPSHIHHRAANPNEGEATYVLKGALIGGPDENGYSDNTSSYQYTEPALDYNGCFALACCGLADLYGTSKSGNTDQPGNNDRPVASGNSFAIEEATNGVCVIDVDHTLKLTLDGNGNFKEVVITDASGNVDTSVNSYIVNIFTGKKNADGTEQFFSLVFTNGRWDTSYDSKVRGAYAYLGESYMVAGGVVNQSANGLQYTGDAAGWKFMAAGKVVRNHAGLVMYQDKWFWIDNSGSCDRDYAAIVNWSGADFLVHGGMLRTDFTGFTYDPQNKSKWYHITNGQVWGNGEITDATIEGGELTRTVVNGIVQ